MLLKKAIAEHTSIYIDHKKGVDFLDYNELLADVDTRLRVHGLITEFLQPLSPDMIYLADARGFLMAGIADAMQLPIQQARKAGKLPGNVIQKTYQKEYDQDQSQFIEIAKQDLSGKKIAVLDDVIATGGTARAILDAIEECGGEAIAFAAIYEVDDLDGRALIEEKCDNILSIATLSEIKKLREEQGLSVTKMKD